MLPELSHLALVCVLGKLVFYISILLEDIEQSSKDISLGD